MDTSYDGIFPIRETVKIYFTNMCVPVFLFFLTFNSIDVECKLERVVRI